MNWETIDITDKYTRIIKLCYGNGQYVGFALKKDLSYCFVVSKDGVTFEECETTVDISFANELEYGNGVYLFTGQDSNENYYIGRSTDGCTWDIKPLPENMTIQLRFVNGQFIILGTDYNNLFVSTDGINFEHKMINATIFYIAYGNGVYIGTYSDGTVYRSYDLENWEKIYTLDKGARCICYGNGKFIIGSITDLTTNHLFVSENNGETWNNIDFDTSRKLDIQKIDYKYGILTFYTNYGIVYTSTDLINFEQYNPDLSSAYDICSGNRNIFVCFTKGLRKTSVSPSSNNGELNWTQQKQNIYKKINGVCYGNGKYVAVTYTGLTEGSVLTSSDGETWTEHTEGISNGLYSVCYKNGVFVATGIGSIYASNNGIDWEKVTPKSVASTLNIHDVCYGNGRFVAVGRLGNEGYVYISSDGFNWESTELIENFQYKGICYGNGQFVAVGYYNLGSSATGYIQTSPDGIEWTTRASAEINGSFNHELISVCYGNGKYVAVSVKEYQDGNPSVFVSSDGIEWTLTKEYTNLNIHDVCYGNGVFTFVGNTLVSNGTYGAACEIFTSKDGNNWTQETTGTSDLSKPSNIKLWGNLLSVCYGNGKYVAVGVGTFSSNESPIVTKTKALSSSGAYNGVDNEYKFNEVYMAQDGEYKLCEIYIAQDGEYKLCGG